MDALATFGPYTILRAIAATRDSVSFAARFEGRKESEHILALKVLRPELTDDDEFAERVVEEMRLAVRLNHVNVAQTFDFARHGDLSYVALEFVDGVPLQMVQQAVERGQKAVTTEVGAFICAEACAGLAYAHGRRDERGKVLGITHSRVSPRSVLLSKSGLVKVVDFGLCRALTSLGESRHDEADLHFLAPELVRGEEFDRRADIFSVGALAYLLFTGRTIYDGATGDDLETKAARGYVPAVLDVDDTVPEPIAELVDKALSSDPDNRFTDATELRSGLAAWLRRNSPGFGRHRLKTYLNRLLPETTYGLLPGAEWETLHRKNFVCYDPDSLVATEIEVEPDVPTEKEDLRELLASPNLPSLGQLDITRMATGAHHTVRDRAVAAASASPAAQPRATATGRQRIVRTPPPMPAVKEQQVFASRSYLDDDASSENDPVESGEQAPVTRPATVSADEDDLHVDIPTDVPERTSVEIDPTMVYDDSIDYGDQLSAVAEADARIRPPRPTGTIVGVILGIVLLAGLAYGGKYYIDQQAAIAGVTPDAPAMVFVTSRPQGAAILLDGSPSGLTTPAPLRELPSEPRSVTVSLQGFDSPSPQTLDPAAPPAQLQFDLEPSAHRVRVDSDPAGAEVIYDGEVVGTTPYVLGPVRIDYRQGIDLVLRLEGYFDEHVSVDWAPDEGESSVRRPMRADPDYVPPEEEG